jgi:hypothetical protein
MQKLCVAFESGGGSILSLRIDADCLPTRSAASMALKPNARTRDRVLISVLTCIRSTLGLLKNGVADERTLQ